MNEAERVETLGMLFYLPKTAFSHVVGRRLVWVTLSIDVKTTLTPPLLVAITSPCKHMVRSKAFRTQMHLLEITERYRLLDVRWHILLHSTVSTWHWNDWKRAAMDWAAMCAVWFLEECRWAWENSHPCSLTVIDGWWISDVMKPTFATDAISGRRAFEQMFFFQRCTFHGCCRVGQRAWADRWWSTRLHFDGRIRSWTLSRETRFIRRGTWSAKRRLRLSDGWRWWRSTV